MENQNVLMLQPAYLSCEPQLGFALLLRLPQSFVFVFLNVSDTQGATEVGVDLFFGVSDDSLDRGGRRGQGVQFALHLCSMDFQLTNL